MGILFLPCLMVPPVDHLLEVITTPPSHLWHFFPLIYLNLTISDEFFLKKLWLWLMIEVIISIFAVSLTWNSNNCIMIRNIKWISFCRKLTFQPGQMSVILIYLIRTKYCEMFFHYDTHLQEKISYLCMSRVKVLWPRTEETSFSPLHIAILYFCVSLDAR